MVTKILARVAWVESALSVGTMNGGVADLPALLGW